MIAIDTNVYLYSVDQADPLKQRRARELLRQLRLGGEPTVLLWQVLCEITQQLRRWRDLGRLSEADHQENLHSARYLFPLLLPTEATFDLAIETGRRFSLSHWDSMIVGACVAGGVTTLYTEDMGASRQIGGVQLVNPFVP